MSPSVPSVSSRTRCGVPQAAAARRRGRLLISLLALLASACAPATAGAAIWPTDDPFYAAPADLATRAPGDVLRSRRTSIKMAPGIRMPFKAFQVLYRTNDRADQPIASVATIILPITRPATGRHLLSYQTAYDGLSPACMPSYSLQTGKVALQGAETLIMAQALSRGWTVVTSDYEGPDNAWLVRKTTARGVLDGVRAAQRFEPAGLDQGTATKVGMMGYSGGGQATIWASEIAKEYAPELNIVGASQGGVAADMGHAYRALDGQLFAGIGFAAIAGIAKGYPGLNLEQYLNNRGKAVIKRLRTKQSCITDFAFAFPFQKFRDLMTVRDLDAVPGFEAVRAENALGHGTPRSPMFMYQTVIDQMDGYKGMKAIAAKYCSEGTKVQFVTGYKEEHAMQSATMPFKAQSWLQDRFNGVPMVTNCGNLG